MWAWLVTLNDEIAQRTIQSLPRELSLAEDNSLRIRPLRELETLRYDRSYPRRSHGNATGSLAQWYRHRAHCQS